MISEALTHKPMTGKCPCRSQSWYIVSISLLIWFTLFYFYSSSLTFGKKSDSFLGNNQTVFIDSSKLSTHDVVEDGTGKNSSRVKNVKIEDNVMNAVDGTKTGGKQIEFYIDRDIDIDRLISSLMTDDNETETFETISGKLLEEELRISARDTEIPIHMGRKNGRRRRRRRRRRGKSGPDPCSGRYIYVHHIPRKFNQDLLDNCPSLSLWTDMCEYTSNLGLGSRLPSNKKLYSERGWFSTNQFLLEVIFHNRMKQYKCLTNDSMVASAVYVPYYAGLDVGRYLWDPIGYRREHDATELVKWLSGRPEWKTMWGRDHFLVAGRINWDFRKDPNNASDWGNGLLNFPESKNMTMLVIESSPWNNNDFAIPYPTYFHPSRDDDVFRWQDRMRRAKRRLLYSFAGAQRPNQNDSIRNEVINQCLGSKKKCRFLECDYKSQRCYQPDNLMKLFQSSIFCLQPPGDSYTRRSIFDSILAGCIPVFFHPASAYVQYIWHFPKNHTKYSVLIPASEVKSGNANIEKLLRSIPKKRIAKMRNEVIKLIPNVIYADPASKLEKIKDAFDLTIKGVLDRVETVSEELKDGKEVNSDFDEQESWKYFTFGKLGGHEWDPFFSTKQGKHGT